MRQRGTIIIAGLLCLAFVACSSSNGGSVSKSGTVDANAGASATASRLAGTPAVTPTAARAPAGTSPTPSAAATLLAPGDLKPQLPVTVKDKDGKTVTINDISRIVSINGDITEVIFALGLGKDVAGIDISTTYPAEATSLPKIGYQRALAAEGVLALKPTLVIGTDIAGPPPVLDQIRGAGVPVLIVTYPETVEASLTKIHDVAQALGVPDQGQRLAAKTQAEIDSAKALAAKSMSKPRVIFLQVRQGPGGGQFIYGTNTAADSLITLAGGINAAADAGIDGLKPLSAEAIVTAAPDIVLMQTLALKDAGGIDGVVALLGVAQTPAGKNKRVIDFEDQYLLGLGPRTGQLLTDLTRALHPELR